MSMFGGGFGGPGAGGGAHGIAGAGPKGESSTGMPFAGIPPELIEGVKHLERHEPRHPTPPEAFSHQMPPPRRLTMLSLISEHRGAFGLVVFLVVLETLLLQAGPGLVQVAIDYGMVPRDARVLLLA